MRKIRCLFAVLFALAIQEGWPVVSDNAFVFTAPARTRLWNTVPGGDVTLPVVYPYGAASARISVRSPGFSRDYADITEPSVTISLPTPSDAASEKVYDLTLSFFDQMGTPLDKFDQHARVAVIVGYDLTSVGSTACRLPKTEDNWGHCKSHSAVIPIPFGPRSLTLDGVPVLEIDNDESATWYQVQGIGDASCALVLNTTDGVFAETLSLTPGFLLLLR